MGTNTNLPKEKTNRIVLFADLRDSTDILIDPDFSIKQETIQVYGEAYAQYCSGNWTAARKKFLDIFREHGLTAGVAMALRCDALAGRPPDMTWKGIWRL